MGNLSLVNKVRNDELTDKELVECLEIKNVVVLQHTILKLISRQLNNALIYSKLLELSGLIGEEFKILGPCQLGHLAIYALKKLGYNDDFQKLYDKLSVFDRELVEMLEKSL